MTIKVTQFNKKQQDLFQKIIQLQNELTDEQNKDENFKYALMICQEYDLLNSNTDLVSKNLQLLLKSFSSMDVEFTK